MDPQTLLTIAGFALAALAVALSPGALMWLSARPYLNPRSRMEPLDPEKHKAFLNANQDAVLWAQRHAWQWLGAYAYPAGTLAETLLEVWRDPALDRYLFAYRHRAKPARYAEFMTIFEGGAHLDTLTSREDLMMPDVPGRFLQVFPDEQSLDTLWSRHEQGERWAAIEHALRPRPATDDFESLWRDNAERIVRDILAKPLWFLRLWVWFFRQATLAGAPVSARRAYRAASV